MEIISFLWQLGLAHEAAMDKILPVDDPAMHRKQPWLLHMLSVNALNFAPLLCAMNKKRHQQEKTSQ
jgi:hypothetical protein